MKRKIVNYLKVFCLFFFMIWGICFILLALLQFMGMPLTDGLIMLVIVISHLLEYGYYLWIKE